ncbi:prolyl oligopeptidase family serine peptidase [Conchiformibius kuhniae]|uniref:Prolyl oligopeptidase family protein n=1 Tax=Conchiformibius kuhniae TaxID=211502 RepID=A0A8T9MWR2_9NEIS|nr:prolyl oligopeptidase family serine peptidase [Conchiformibius kuhniae]UOP04632.1 prolyl oligopeptidase family serine peptidase [Conchiformibius kuhniae]
MTCHDPFAALENLHDPATRDFARAAHAETLARFAADTAFDDIKNDVAALLRDERQIPFCQEHRAKMYHFHQSAEHPKGVYRVCSSASYRAGIPDWQVLFAVADFDALLNDDVYLDGVSHYVERPERVLLSLSAGGGDAAYTLEFDLASGKLVEQGFHFPAAKSHIAWRDENSLWVCPAWDAEQLTASGYPREVWLMRRGQTFEQAQLVYRMDTDGVMVHAWRYLDGQGAPVDLLEAATGFFRKSYFRIAADGSTHKLNLPEDAEICGYLAGQLLVRLKGAWQRANRHYPAGALLAVKLDKYGTGAAHTLFVPNERQALESVETTKRFVVACVSDNVAGTLRGWRWQDGQWQTQDLPALPGGAVEITDQPWGGDVLYLAASGFLTPLTLYALDLNVMELCVMRRQPAQFDPQGMDVVQHHAVSADGTRIPYYRVGRNDDGADTPTVIYAYGGFDVAELPHYLGSIGRHWLANGGAFVLANIRGGGEFAGWHEAAVREHKHKSADDLLAVAEDVYARGLATPERTAFQGGSNGGLVCAAATVRAPQRIGALVCEVPLTDMLRYHRLSAGASWLEEYGNPDNEHDRPHLARLSPYHNLDGQTAYPPVLLTTSLSDDRVHPAHALKFYAKLRQTPCARVWLYAPEHGGHTGNATQEHSAAEFACILRFLHGHIAS